MLAAYQGPLHLHTKGTRHLGDSVQCLAAVFCRACAEGILPQPEMGLPALLCCSGLFTYHNGVRAQEEILTLHSRQRMLQTEGPSHMWDSVIGSNSGATVNPKAEQKTSAQLLLLESYLETKVTLKWRSEAS